MQRGSSLNPHCLAQSWFSVNNYGINGRKVFGMNRKPPILVQQGLWTTKKLLSRVWGGMGGRVGKAALMLCPVQGTHALMSPDGVSQALAPLTRSAFGLEFRA